MKTLPAMVRVLIVMTGLALSAHAYPFVTCKSTYVTNGWFDYELTVHNDIFFYMIDSLGFATLSGTNALTVGPMPAGWTNGIWTNELVWSYWSYPGTPLVPLPRPQVVHMSFQSPYTSFRTDTQGQSYVTFSGQYRDFICSPYLSVNLVGFLRLSGLLVPCPETEADGSPPTRTAICELVPDIKITGFLVESNCIQGIHFSWDSTFTMGVEASWDGIAWSNVAWVVGDQGANTWRSSRPLEQIGKYFRLLLYSRTKYPEMVH